MTFVYDLIFITCFNYDYKIYVCSLCSYQKSKQGNPPWAQKASAHTSTKLHKNWCAVGSSTSCRLFCYSVFWIALKKNKSQDNHKELSITIFSVLLKTWRYDSPYFYFYARLHSQDSEGQNRSLQPLTPNSFQNWTSRNPDLLMSNGIIFLGVTRINPMFNLKE